ncbi:MAG: S49 family peptidase [Ectothiorhodospiraceae bacterium]|nr:S49 family peptidase [Ectothiorhodospiraceae bacterium]
MSDDRWTSGPLTRRSRAADTSRTDDERWEREALRDIALEGIRERRLARRWGIFFKLLFLGYLFLVLALARGWVFGPDPGPREHTAVVKVSGVLLPDSSNRAELVIRGLQAAFRDSGTRAVVLYVNSPGGSPVQASQINDEVRRLKEAYPEIPVYAVADDMFTSGAYYLAVSADRIFVDRATMIGSIGVIAQGFGVDEALDRLGIERRLYTAGESKALLDPFSPEREEDVAWIEGLLDEIHQQFIDAVRTGRGDRLADNADLFSGLVWTGQQGVELGLADDIGSLHSVARDVVGVEHLKDFTVRPNLLQQLGGRIGSSVMNRIEELLLSEATLR